MKELKDRIKRFQHKGRMITYVNYSGLGNDCEAEFIKLIDEFTQFILKHGKHQLMLVNVENAYANGKIVSKMKSDSILTKEHLDKQAVVGINKIKTIFLKGINLFAKIEIKPFKTEAEALEYLISKKCSCNAKRTRSH